MPRAVRVPEGERRAELAAWTCILLYWLLILAFLAVAGGGPHA